MLVHETKCLIEHVEVKLVRAKLEGEKGWEFDSQFLVCRLNQYQSAQRATPVAIGSEKHPAFYYPIVNQCTAI